MSLRTVSCPTPRRRFFHAALTVFLVSISGALNAGPLQRVPNTTLAMPAAPPTFGYTSTNAFPAITFTNPVSLTAPPGETNRLFVVGKDGDITVITNLAAPNLTMFMDLTGKTSHQNANSGIPGEKGMLGLAFHPGYASNGWFYVLYMSTNSVNGGFFDNLSRFTVSGANPNRGDTNTEVVIYSQRDRDDNHNGGDIHFGPDGYLYISVGDEGAEHDGRNVAQLITNNLFAGFLRIDVDKRPGNLPPNPAPSTLITSTNYLVPADNPYVGATSFDGIPINASQVRTEFWAVGLRNPWRWCFDPLTGVIYCGDVGQDHFEELDVIQRAGNYGWAYFEGTNVATGGTLPHTSYVTNQAANLYFPIVHYIHGSAADQGNCIIGGAVYRGARLPQLAGSYVYGDYVSGNIWTLPAANFTNSPTLITGATGTGTPIISDSTARVTCFGVDPASGDVFYAATKTTGFATAATIQRIIYNNVTNGAPLPATLADTGAFTNLLSLTTANDPLLPAAGIVPYDINLPFWSDNAIKSRWFSVPNTNLTIGFNANGNWSFPTGTVWVKHFNLQLTNGDPASEIRLETRLLVKNAGGVYGVTYRWGNSKTNATLVAAAGLDEPFVINDAGTLRTQVWHYPSQLECQACHTPEGGFGLGFRTEQLNKDFTYAGGATNEILAYRDAGYFSAPVTNDVSTLLALATATNTSASLEFRARSFLAANCSQCHQPGGSASPALWDARITTPTALAGVVNGALANNLGDVNNHVITPLSPGNSVLLTRISTRGANSIQMPPLDSNLIDAQATNLMSQWILSLSNTFWVGVSPDTQSVAPGNNAPFTVTVLATSDFTNSVTLTASGLPAGTSASFSPPSVTGSATSTLTVSTLNSTPTGNYVLTITGAGGGQTNSDTLSLFVSTNAPAIPGLLVWTFGSGADTNWSDALNWTNLTAFTNSAPGPANDLLFTNTAAASSAVVPNNFVNGNFAVASLQYANNAANTSPNYHVTLIGDGQALVITNGLAAGTGTAAGDNQVVNAVVTGAGGALSLTGGNLAVSQGTSTSGAESGVTPRRATLDLSGLGNFTANVSRIFVGVQNQPAGSGVAALNRTVGSLYLARTNLITVNSTGVVNGFLIGTNNQNGATNVVEAVYLGQTNAIFADSIAIGVWKQNGLLAFNPANLSSPAAYFRNRDGVGRVSFWNIGDMSATSSSTGQGVLGTNDFTGGSVDALVNTLIIGATTPGSITSANGHFALGALTFGGGVVDVNNLTNGWMNSAGTTTVVGKGVVNVNGGALVVNNVLALALKTGANNAVGSTAAGTLNVNGGAAVIQGSLIAGAGTSSVSVTNGALILTNAASIAGTPAAPIGAVTLSGATLRLRVNGGATATNLVASTLTAAGVNTIVIDSAANVTTTRTFPLVSYAALTGSVAANFTLGSVPPNFAGALIDNAARKTIDLQLTHPPATPVINPTLAGTNLLLDGTNGATNWTFYLLTSTNVSLPLTNWTSTATGLFDNAGAFHLTNGVDPASAQKFYLLQLP